MYKGGFAGTGRTVGPNPVGRIKLGGEHETVLTAESLQQVGVLGAVKPAVDGDDGVFVKHFSQPLVDGGVVAHVLLHHHETAVLELDACLQEVARVGPQGGLVKRYDGRAVAAREAADPVTELPVVTDVFTLVRVGAGNDDGIDIQAAHFLAQRLKARKSFLAHCL